MALDERLKKALDSGVNRVLAESLDGGCIGPKTMNAAKVALSKAGEANPNAALLAEVEAYLSERFRLPRPSEAGGGQGARGGAPGAPGAADAPVSGRAPYRMIPLPAQVRLADPQPGDAEDALGGLHDRPLADGFCGEIRVLWEAETPLLIGDHDGGPGARPMRLPPNGRYILPGASIKGMLRGVSEILAEGRLAFYTPKEQGGENLEDLAARSGALHRTRQQTPVDRVEALFGYVREPDDRSARTAPRDLALKGRVSVGCAWLSADSAPCEEPRDGYHPAHLSSPNAFCRPFYRTRGTDGTVRLAGRKRYMTRFPEGAASFTEFGVPTAKSAKTQSPIRFLAAQDPEAPLRFEGAIKLHNLSPGEVGLLLWALTHGGATDAQGLKPFRHLIGRAKNYGAGQLRLVGVELRLAPNGPEGERLREPPREIERTAHRGEGFLLAPGEDAWSMRPFLDRFQAEMRRPGGPLAQWPQTAGVCALLFTAMPRMGADLKAKGQLAYSSKDETDRLRQVLDDRRRPFPGAAAARYLKLDPFDFLADAD